MVELPGRPAHDAEHATTLHGRLNYGVKGLQAGREKPDEGVPGRWRQVSRINPRQFLCLARIRAAEGEVSDADALGVIGH